MSRQRFTTTNVLALEVQDDPRAGGVLLAANLVANPSGDLGAWGWQKPPTNTRIRTHDTGHGLRFETTAAGVASGVKFRTELAAVEAPTFGKSEAHRLASSGNYSISPAGGVMPVLRVNFYNAARAYLGQTSSVGGAQNDGATAFGYGNAPAGAIAYVALEVTLLAGGGGTLPSGAYIVLDDVAMVAADEPVLVAEPDWIDVLSGALDVDFGRTELDVGDLTAHIRDATLDPAVAPAIRKGKPVRLLCNGEALFLGTLDTATVNYALLEDDPAQRANITLTAVDATKKPAGTPSPNGVATVAELAPLFAETGIPWNLDGDTDHTAAGVPVAVSTNPAATLLDQVALTRDTVLGYAWVDRRGAVNVWNAAALAAAGDKVLGPVLDETRYTDVDVDYDPDRLINSVGIKYLRLDPVTGETEELTYGPYRDEDSVRRWDVHHEDFTIHGLDEASLDDYAAAILAANAAPHRAVTEALLTLRTDADVADFALVDLYDLAHVTNDRAGVDESLRVVSIRHRITPKRWTITLGFAGDNTVAPPQLTPSPIPTAVATLAQLLRPVGEVTMMMGLPSQVWPGWLVLNGAALTLGEYPELEAWLAAAGLSTTVLPDFTDRLPVAAGVKALGAKTGAWTKTLTAAQVPAHSHGYDRRAGAAALGSAASAAAPSATGTLETGTTKNNTSGTGGNADPVDITPRVIGVYFVIRAKSGV